MLKQGQFQKMLQKLSPQQIQLIKLLQVPTDSLEERIKEELEVNPALEEGMEDDTPAEEREDQQLEETGDEDSEEESREETDSAETENTTEEATERNDSEAEQEEEMIVDDAPDLNDYTDDDDETADYKLRDDNYPEQDEKRTLPMPVFRSFHEYLEEQLGMEELDEHLHSLGEYIIGSIDDDGYLRRSLDAMVDDLAFSQNVTCTEKELEEVLKVIQRFDPPGTGCRDLQECLLLQLDRKVTHPAIKELTIKVVKDHFDEFVKKHYEKLQKQLEIDDELFKQIINTIVHLNPKPGSAYTSAGDLEKIIIPDFYIANNDGLLELSLNQMNVPDLRISQQFRDMLRDYQKGTKKDRQQREAVMFIKQKIDSAKWFIDAIRQRQQTLLLTMNAIMEYQYDYLVSGDETKLRPMILKDIAETTGLDISTVSRVANSKYVQTEWGTLKLKSFFSESLSTDSGEEVSTREVKKILLDMISIENKKKPLSDEKLTDLLKEKGYNIARRTVAKYREQLEIPVARLRKQL